MVSGLKNEAGSRQRQQQPACWLAVVGGWLAVGEIRHADGSEKFRVRQSLASRARGAFARQMLTPKSIGNPQYVTKRTGLITHKPNILVDEFILKCLYRLLKKKSKKKNIVPTGGGSSNNIQELQLNLLDAMTLDSENGDFATALIAKCTKKHIMNEGYKFVVIEHHQQQSEQTPPTTTNNTHHLGPGKLILTRAREIELRQFIVTRVIIVADELFGFCDFQQQMQTEGSSHISRQQVRVFQSAQPKQRLIESPKQAVGEKAVVDNPVKIAGEEADKKRKANTSKKDENTSESDLPNIIPIMQALAKSTTTAKPLPRGTAEKNLLPPQFEILNGRQVLPFPLVSIVVIGQLQLQANKGGENALVLDTTPSSEVPHPPNKLVDSLVFESIIPMVQKGVQVNDFCAIRSVIQHVATQMTNFRKVFGIAKPRKEGGTCFGSNDTGKMPHILLPTSNEVNDFIKTRLGIVLSEILENRNQQEHQTEQTFLQTGTKAESISIQCEPSHTDGQSLVTATTGTASGTPANEISEKKRKLSDLSIEQQIDHPTTKKMAKPSDKDETRGACIIT